MEHPIKGSVGHYKVEPVIGWEGGVTMDEEQVLSDQLVQI